MDDSCAVCAETLEWVAYGSCGHREVCSTCLARLRCICEDRRCCICKSESNIIFVTKGLGDFTRMINDFSVFPANPAEGNVGSYWYHEDSQAYFDDFDQYKMIKAMCRLSCSICDRFNQQNKEWVRRNAGFKNIEQLKGHLFHQHNLFMCSLCLEGRKIFICEQKLYTRAQLNRHVKTGDSVVDGSENERGGFTGHPLCEFCLNPFYGENELYQHMSTEHYTCHLCQRQNPGQYEYYKNYDDLEIHFRQEHFLCEDESCLSKKFIVFPSESEMKRHNAKEHGGQMSRSKRNAALQIPTSFRYRRNNDQDRHGRGRSFHRDPSDELASAIEASLETPDAGTLHDTGSNTQSGFDHRETNAVESVLTSFDSLAIIDPQPSSTYRVAVEQDLHGALFPPLPAAAPNKAKHKSVNSLDVLGGNTIAARLRRNNNGTVKVLNRSTAWPSVSHQPSSSSSSYFHSNPRPSSASTSGTSDKPNTDYSSVAKAAASSFSFASGESSATDGIISHKGPFNSSMDFPPVSSVVAKAVSVNSISSSEKSRHKGHFHSSAVEFPPVSSTQTNKQPNIATQPLMMVEDIYAAANKSLVERIRAALDFDENKYGAFKVISADYRQNLIDTWEYVANVHQFGLSHLLLELARLCPDPHKQKMLVEIYTDGLKSEGSCNDENGTDKLKNQSSRAKSKAKRDDSWGACKSKNNLSNGILNSVRHLQANYKPSEEEEVVLSKDGYRSASSKSKTVAVEGSRSRDVESGNKQQKKTCKFLRMRLGEDSSAALLGVNSNGGTREDGKSIQKEDDSCDGVAARGAWKNGGGQRLVGKNYRK